jgi:hypothetical protein
MKTIMGMFYGVLAGVFLATGVIVFTQLIGAGADLLGFTVWTYRYYVLCLCICVALLASSKACRQYWMYMGGFFLAIILVVAIGFQASAGVSAGEGQIGQMQENLGAMASMLAKAVMYCAPAALTAFYAFIAFDSLPRNYSSQEKS